MKNGITISFFGSSLVSAYWNGAATYYRGIIRALNARGHRITFFEPDAFNRQQHRDISNPEYARSVVYPATEQGANEALKEACESDVIVKTSGVGVLDNFLEQAVLKYQKPGKIIVFWDVDAPVTLDRMKTNPDDPFRFLVKKYDLIFTYGGGDPVVRAYRQFGARRCVPIYNAIDPDSHFPVPPEARFKSSLSFMGNRLPDRELRVKEFFFEPARLLPEHVFLLGGSGWDASVPELANVKRIGHIYTREHNAFNCSSLAVLNINRQSMADYGYSPATRVFEAAGAGACIITDEWEGVGTFLDPGTQCLVVSCGADVAKVLQQLDPDRACQIGNSARERVLSEHTYAHRAYTVESVLDLYLGNQKGADQ